LPDEIREAKDHGWASEQIIIGTHMGTHIDAPSHFDSDETQDIASVGIERTFGDAVLLDFRTLCEKGNHAITVEELDAEVARRNETIDPGDIVVIQTGHSARYAYGPGASLEKYTDLCSGLAYDAPRWFIEKKVKLVGIDGPSLDIDVGCSAHVNFLMRKRIGKEPILIVENLANLEKVTASRFKFFALPLPIAKGSGSPVRAVAFVA
jgi:kynurenine formamidase